MNHGGGAVNRSRMQLTLDLMPYLIMGAVTVVAVLLGPGAGVLPLLSLGPAFAAVTGGVRHTVIIGGVALALCAALTLYQSVLASQQDILAMTTVAGVTVAGVIASTGRQRREQHLADVTAVAEVTQQVLLRPVPASVGPVALAVRYVSAASGARIGGDLYDVVQAGDGVRLIIGDVQGKGLPAVLTAATVLGAFREAAHDAPGLPQLAERIEASLARQLTEEEFVTAFLAEVSGDGSRLVLLNCGHPPPLLLRDGTARYLEEAQAGLPLGLSQIGGQARGQAMIGLRAGDRILFYTDGISEARNKTGEFFPLSGQFISRNGQDPGQLLDQLSHDVTRHVGHALDDDAAMLLLRHDCG